MTIYTIGYEGLAVDDFVGLLRAWEIDTVVDVRELPLSRKKGFSKTSLCERLSQDGLGYEHMANLGCPRSVRYRYRADGDWSRYTMEFLAHLRTQTAAVMALAERASAERCALLCFEADAAFCHRSMVADAVHEVCGARVAHIPVKAMPVAGRQLAFA